MSQILLLLKTGYWTWLWLPINCLLLFIDGVVYTCVGLSYRLFQLMAQLNFNALSSWMTALIDRINAIIAVLILFILGYSLIQYLINPDKANDKSKAGGIAVIKNIAISAVLLISYGFIFGVMNEFTFVLVGTPSTYKYTYLNDLFGVENDGGDEGLIMRLIVGGESTLDDGSKVDYGRKLAITTLSSFLHGYEEDGLYSREEGWDKSMVGEVYDDALKADDFNLIGTLITVVGEVGRSVYYFPIISTALGVYIVYTIIMASIELGIRAFKLMVLQIIAPVAIITIMKDGPTKTNKVWGNYLSTLTKTYADAFIRIGAMYFAFAFISVAYNNLDELFAGAPDADGFTKILLYGLIIISALKLGKELPKMIDGVFGSKLAENNKVGLGQFLATTAGIAGGYGLGALTGGLAGAGTRWRNSRNAGLSFGRSLLNAARGGASGAFTGGFSGAAAGSHLKGDKVSDYFKTGKNVFSEGWRAGGPGIGGFMLGMRQEYGRDSVTSEKEAIANLESSREYALKSAKRITHTNGFDYTIDPGAMSKSAAVAKVRDTEAFRRLEADIEDARSGKRTGLDLTALVRQRNDIISDVESTYADAEKSILENDEAYRRDVGRAAKLYGDTDNSRYYSDSSRKISELKIETTHKEYERKRNGVSTPKGGK